MKKQDYVFQLIRSLTRGEKRNFRMLGQLTSGSKKYLQLFDCMDGMDAYDEARILKKFRKDPSFEKQFAYNKNYLYNAILNSLTYFHKGPNAEVSSLTLQVEILMQKNLYSQARKLLRKAKERVTAQEKFEDLLKLYRFEVEILRFTEDYKILYESMRQVEIEEKITLEKISNHLRMKHLTVRSEVLFATTGMARREDDLRKFHEICATPEMESEDRALSIRAKIMYNQIMRRIYHLRGEHDKALPLVDRAIELYEMRPQILEDDKSNYLKMLGAGINHSFNLYGLEGSEHRLQKVMDLKVNNAQERLFKFTRVYLFYLTMHSDQGKKAPEAFLEEFDHELKKLWKEIPPQTKLMAMYSLMVYYHTQGEHSSALKALNEFLNQPRTGIATPIQGADRIYNLVIHFELG
jgi:tetratricopeptide (TPR) repeat protein